MSLESLVSLGFVLASASSAAGADLPHPRDQWQLIFKQTVPTYFNKGEWQKGKEGDATFSNLQDLESYRLPDDSFHFYLNYPQLGNGNEWSQTSNPVTKTTPGVDGYKPIDIEYDANHWGGLEHSGTYALLDGSVNRRNWNYAIGSFGSFGHIPGPNAAVNVVELYVKKPSSSGGIAGCECSDHTETAHRGKTIGQCVDKLQGKFWCYVKNGVRSTCPDKKKSRRGDQFWSFVACDSYDVYVPITG